MTKREHIEPLAKLFNLYYNELFSLWLADQVFQFCPVLMRSVVVNIELENATI